MLLPKILKYVTSVCWFIESMIKRKNMPESFPQTGKLPGQGVTDRNLCAKINHTKFLSFPRMAFRKNSLKSTVI